MRLSEVERKIPDIFTYKGERYTKISYSMAWNDKKNRSLEIIWENDAKTKQVYLFGDEIELIEYGKDMCTECKKKKTPSQLRKERRRA